MLNPSEIELFRRANDEWAKGDLKSAFKLFKLSATVGSKLAYNSLAYFYDQGLGTRFNKVNALYWYRRAARSGDVCAYANLGMCYRDLGNRRLALHWFSRAVKCGDGDAALELAKLYSIGRQASTRMRATGLLEEAITSLSITPDSRSEALQLLKGKRKKTN